MTALLELKQRMKMIYAKYDIYLIPAAKFIIALAAFLMINSQIGFMEKLASPVVAILLALLCSFLPVNMIVLFGALMVCFHAFALSMEVFAVAAGIFFVMYAVYFRVCPGQGYVLVLTPLAFAMGIPYAMPLVLGLVGGPVCAVPMAFGTIIYYLMYYMKNNETMITNSETETMATRMTFLVENVLNNKAVIMTILILAIVLMVVYAIRRMSADYAWYGHRLRGGFEYCTVSDRRIGYGSTDFRHWTGAWNGGFLSACHDCGVFHVQCGLLPNRIYAV